jgi:hypothetical protein
MYMRISMAHAVLQTHRSPAEHTGGLPAAFPFES